MKYISNNTALKFIEMFQYTVIVLILSIIIALIYNKIFNYITFKGDSLPIIFINLLIDNGKGSRDLSSTNIISILGYV